MKARIKTKISLTTVSNVSDSLTCKICRDKSSLSANLTNMALLKIKDQKEFQDKVGMMCTTHAEEMAQRIMKEKVLLKRTSKGQEEREEAHDGQDDCRDFTEIACKF